MQSRKIVCVTGANGFLGLELCAALSDRFGLIRCTRHQIQFDSNPSINLEASEIGKSNISIDHLKGVDTVVHTAAITSVGSGQNAEDSCIQFNVESTLDLAKKAIEAGVKNFIFISTIKVCGESSGHIPFSERCSSRPENVYALSKALAEEKILDLAKPSSMKIIIIRPPLIYGPGVKGNFKSLMGSLHKGVPLPLGSVHNKRSLIAIGNLVDFIVTCLDHPAAANQIFLVSDREDLSTTQLLRRLGAALGRPTRLIPIPAVFLRFAAIILRRKDVSDRLLGSLLIDCNKAHNLLGWSPPLTVDEALRMTTQHFLENCNTP